MTLHNIKKFYIQWFNVRPNITSTFRTIAIFKTFVKQNKNSNKIVDMSINFYCTINFVQT
jgi:hypothetical protein